MAKHTTITHAGSFLCLMYDELDKVDNGAVKKMGTTMTCLVLHRGGALVAHIGDSRVYHIRPSLADEDGRSGIIYQSADHSLVNDLLRAGEITEEEAIDFPQKNVITRAMQPHLERRYKADILNIDDVQAGDYFFLCCDGVLEQLTNDTLGEILKNQTLDDNAKVNAIKKVCDGKTHDNYTCWLIPVFDVQKEETDVAQDDEDQVAVTVEQAPHEVQNDAETERLARKDAKLKAQQEAMRQREAAQKTRVMAAAARKAGGQRQSSGVPPIPPKQIAQQERAEEKKKMVKFALLSFAVIVGAFILFYPSEDKPQKPTRSEEVSNVENSGNKDTNHFNPKSNHFLNSSQKSAPPRQVAKKDTAKTTPKETTPTLPPTLSPITGNGNNGGDPGKNAPGEQDEKHGGGNENSDSPVSGNPASEASSSSDAIDI